VNQQEPAYRPLSSVLSRSFADEVLVTLPKASQCHVLTGSAAIGWDLLSRQATEGDLVARLCDLYGECREVVQDGIRTFVRDLLASGLIERVD
jgi:hypothetical protein